MKKLPDNTAQQAIGIVLMVILWFLFWFLPDLLQKHLQITR